MALFRLQPLVSDVELISKSLLQSTKLSAESLGVFCFALSCAGSDDFTIDGLAAAWNDGRSKEKSIGAERMRRLVNEWRLAGFVYEAVEIDDAGGVTKKFAIFPQTHVSESRSAGVAASREEVEKPKPHKFPAAQIFQEYFKVDLDLDAMRHIEKEVGGNLKMWGQVCADHYNSLTQQQKNSITYKTKAIKFALNDLRAFLERQAMRATKTPMEKEPPDKPKKTFADYIESGGYRFGSEEYGTFKRRWLERAGEKGNTQAIEQVEEYEGIQLSLERLQKRKGSKPE